MKYQNGVRHKTAKETAVGYLGWFPWVFITT